MTPTYADQTQQYSDIFENIRSPLQFYGDSLDETVMQRGGFPFVVISNPVQAGTGVITAIVDCAFAEPIFLSPFFWGQGNAPGLFNVNSLDFNFSFLTNAAFRMWSHDNQGGTNVITSGSIAFGGQVGGPSGGGVFPMGTLPLLIVQYLTPQETQIIPPSMPLTYSYFDVQRYVSNLGQIQGAVKDTYYSNNIQLNSIPRRVYVYIRPSNSALYNDPSLTDTYFQISNMSVQFQNKSGLLASASMEQLYQMSVKNHCNMSWTQWSGGPVYTTGLIPTGSAPLANPSVNTIGSIVCLEFGTDIGLDSLDSAGKQGQYMLQIQLTASSLFTPVAALYPNGIECSMYIITVLEGTFTIEGLGRASSNIGVISSKDILDAKQNPFINYRDVEQVYGGNFLSGLKDFGNSILSGIKSFVGNKGISTVLGAIPHPYAQVGSQVARTLGFGEGVYAGEEAGEGVAAGGAYLNKKDLRRRLKKY